jgi:hypothetical protein
MLHDPDRTVVWAEYERREEEIAERGLSPDEYEREIRKLCEEMGI